LDSEKIDYGVPPWIAELLACACLGDQGGEFYSRKYWQTSLSPFCFKEGNTVFSWMLLFAAVILYIAAFSRFFIPTDNACWFFSIYSQD